MVRDKKVYIKMYILDWVSLAVVGVLCIATSFIKPYQREFSVTDKTIQHIKKKDTVPFWAAVVVAYIVPVFIIIAFTLFKKRRSYFALHTGILAISLAQLITLLFTNIIKNLAGRMRPDFISRCVPNISAINQANGLGSSNNAALVRDPTFGLFTTSICTAARDSVFQDGMRSFPSGHSSASFCGLFFLSLFLAGNMFLYDRKGYAYKAILVTIPVLIAALIVVSRVSDYRHHWQDVLAGSLLGIVVSYYVYYIYYPKLKSDNARFPHKARIEVIEGYELDEYAHQPTSNINNSNMV